MEGQPRIYYDEEGDYLEIFVGDPVPNYGEDIEDNVTLFKDNKTGSVIGIGILDFRKRTKSLKDIELNLPFRISFLQK